MIIIVPNFLPKQICDKLIQIYKNNENKSSVWDCTNPLHLNILDSEDRKFCQKVINVVNNKAVVLFGNNIYLEHPEIVKWNIGCNKNFHHDDTRLYTTLASITYLNDDYEGGETFFEKNLSITPECGKTIFFDGKQYLHGVNCVKNKKRYALSLWYTNNLEQSFDW